MKIYPTLNLQNGRVVSTAGMGESCLLTPWELADYLIEEGATRLALVDVDAAMGRGNNRDLIGQILHRCHARERKVCVQIAGGIRSSDQAQFFIDLAPPGWWPAPSSTSPPWWPSSSWPGSSPSSRRPLMPARERCTAPAGWIPMT
ncbi:MAG: hypothetical protein HYR61_02670 [Acidobacteria bacterium]|nr:hypothetical protein [Acidobacteriota bacterium]